MAPPPRGGELGRCSGHVAAAAGRSAAPTTRLLWPGWFPRIPLLHIVGPNMDTQPYGMGFSWSNTGLVRFVNGSTDPPRQMEYIVPQVILTVSGPSPRRPPSEVRGLMAEQPVNPRAGQTRTAWVRYGACDSQHSTHCSDLGAKTTRNPSCTWATPHPRRSRRRGPRFTARRWTGQNPARWRRRRRHAQSGCRNRSGSAGTDGPVGRSSKEEKARSMPVFGISYSFLPPSTVAGQYEIKGCIAHGRLADIWHWTATSTIVRWCSKASSEFRRCRGASWRWPSGDSSPRWSIPRSCRSSDTDQHGEPVGYIVMEYVGGQSLKKRKGDRLLAVAEAIAYVLEILGLELSALDRSGLQRSREPENLMLTEEQLKLIDLGAVSRINSFGYLYGTPGYQAPMWTRTEWPATYTVSRSLPDIEVARPRWPLRRRPPGGRSGARRVRLVRPIVAPCNRSGPAPAVRQRRGDVRSALGVLREVVAQDTGATPSLSTIFSRSRATFGEALLVAHATCIWTAMCTRTCQGDCHRAPSAAGRPHRRRCGSAGEPGVHSRCRRCSLRIPARRHRFRPIGFRRAGGCSCSKLAMSPRPPASSTIWPSGSVGAGGWCGIAPSQNCSPATTFREQAREDVDTFPGELAPKITATAEFAGGSDKLTRWRTDDGGCLPSGSASKVAGRYAHSESVVKVFRRRD